MVVDLSLIVTTYNRLDALALVLKGIAAQKIQGVKVEVLIADDGSREDTGAAVRQAAAQFPFPLRHVWHEDRGFRAGAIRNLAAQQSQGRYLVFLDGDCVPSHDFLQRHWSLAQPGWSVAGNRVLLSEAYYAKVAAQASVEFLQWDAADCRAAHQRGDINKRFPHWRLPDGFWRKLKPKDWTMFRTCNVGVWREDFERVNGFDDDFQGWGYEDSDLAVRLIRAGVKIKNGRFSGALFHLWHRENDRSKQEENWTRFQQALQSDHIRARRGLDQVGSLS